MQQAAIGSRYALASGDIVRLSGRQVGWIAIAHGTIGVMELPQPHGSGEGPRRCRRGRGSSPARPRPWRFGRARHSRLPRSGPRSIASMDASWRALCRRIDEDTLAEARRLRLRSGLNRQRRTSIVGRLAGIIRPGRSIAARRGRGRPSARRLPGGWSRHGPSRSRLPPVWRRTADDLARAVRIAAGVAGANTAPVAARGLADQQCRSVRRVPWRRPAGRRDPSQGRRPPHHR